MQVKTLTDPDRIADLVDWGPVPDMIEGHSQTSGVLLHKGADGASECGVWVCTPGVWPCHVARDEFTHFLKGSATYVDDSGTQTHVGPGTVAFFPQGWRGTCRVHETVRKVYMIR